MSSNLAYSHRVDDSPACLMPPTDGVTSSRHGSLPSGPQQLHGNPNEIWTRMYNISANPGIVPPVAYYAGVKAVSGGYSLPPVAGDLNTRRYLRTGNDPSLTPAGQSGEFDCYGSMDGNVNGSIFLRNDDYDDLHEGIANAGTGSEFYMETPLPLCEGLGRTDYNVASLTYPVLNGAAELNEESGLLDLHTIQRNHSSDKGIDLSLNGCDPDFERTRRDGMIVVIPSSKAYCYGHPDMDEPTLDLRNQAFESKVVKKENIRVKPNSGTYLHSRTTEKAMALMEAGTKSKLTKRMTTPLSQKDQQKLQGSPSEETSPTEGKSLARATVSNIQMTEFMQG